MSSANPIATATRSTIFSLLAVFAGLFFSVGCTESKTDTVNLAIWGNYLSEETRLAFTKETGITINVTNYSSNEELLAKVQAGGSGLDVAVPSDYMVDVMMKLDLLEPLQREQIKTFEGLDPHFLAQSFDPANRFSLPYAWSTTGIAVNRDLYKGPITSWKDLLENPELTGKFSLLDDVREVTGAVLKMQGQSVNTTDQAILDKAKEALLKIRPRVKLFSSNGVDILKNKEVAAAHVYSTDALQAMAKNKAIEFVLPSEGTIRAIDNLVIVKGAPHLAAAHRLIEFLLRLENDVNFVTQIRAGPVVKGVREKLPADLRDSPSLFPSPERLAKFERLTDLGEKNRPYEEIWTAVKTAR